MSALHPYVLPEADRVLARAAGENFPVALRGLRRAHREALLAIYAFARLADEIGDALEGDRLAALDWLEGELERAFSGRAQHPIARRLGRVVDRHALPSDPFRRLIEANRRDQRVHRYERFDELLDYCAHSANPVGALVLHVFDAATPRTLTLSDRICTALQLTEHWQDVAEDARSGRIYLPGEDLARFGCDASSLDGGHASLELRALLRFEVERARRLFDEGEPLLAQLRGRPRLAVAAFLAGGRAALDAIEAADFDVLPGAPRPRRRAFVRHFLAAFTRATRGSRAPLDGLRSAS